MLCAGLGTRLRPLTFSTAKHLLPVANKPILHFGIENLVAVGAREIGLIVSKESRPILEAAVGDGSRWGVAVSYIDQPAPHGLAHACQCAEAFVAGEPFVMYLSDNLFPEGLGRAVDRFHETGAAAVVILKEVEDPRAFGVAELDGERIVRLVEKPKEPRSNLAIAGGYVFAPAIFESIRNIKPSWRNELEITDAIQNLIDRGLKVVPYILTSYWKDAGTPRDILDANRVVLDQIQAHSEGSVDSSSQLEGVVSIGRGTRIERSRIIGPAIIGADAHIVDAVVGPYAAIGDRVEVVDCVISDSVVMEDSSLRGITTPLAGCLIGRKAKVSPATATASLTLGDQCEIEM